MSDSREVAELKEKIDYLTRKCSILTEEMQLLRTRCYDKAGENFDKKNYGLITICDNNFREQISQNKNTIKKLNSKIEILETARIELLNRCDELEKQLETMESLPVQPIEVAKLLINSEYEYETSEIQRRLLHKGDTDTCERYNIDELEQIAEHLLIYCKHNRGCEE